MFAEEAKYKSAAGQTGRLRVTRSFSSNDEGRNTPPRGLVIESSESERSVYKRTSYPLDNHDPSWNQNFTLDSTAPTQLNVELHRKPRLRKLTQGARENCETALKQL